MVELKTVVLIHWNEAEAQARLAALRAAGFAPRLAAPQNGAALQELYAAPPHAFVIDLSRQPSTGRAIGLELRRRKATRRVPLVFAGGLAEKVEATRRILPDAAYLEWPDLAPGLRDAIANAPAEPAVPNTMAGYSGVALPKKLGIPENSTVLLLGAPADFRSTLGELPAGARLVRGSTADRVLLFTRSLADLQRRFAGAAERVAEGGGLWIVWPKRTSGKGSDLGELEVRALGLAAGWVDYKICAVDATWSGLQFARRRGRGK